MIEGGTTLQRVQAALGGALRAKIQGEGLSASRASEESGLHRETLLQAQRGCLDPHLSTFLALCDFAGYNPGPDIGA